MRGGVHVTEMRPTPDSGRQHVDSPGSLNAARSIPYRDMTAADVSIALSSRREQGSQGGGEFRWGANFCHAGFVKDGSETGATGDQASVAEAATCSSGDGDGEDCLLPTSAGQGNGTPDGAVYAAGAACRQECLHTTSGRARRG